MARALHIVARDAERDSLDQLAMLAETDAMILSVGPPPNHAALAGRIQPVYGPLRSPRLWGWAVRNGPPVPAGGVIHAWSPIAAEAGLAMATCQGGGAPVILSLARRPGRASFKKLVRPMRDGRLHLALATDWARDQLLAAGAPERMVHLLGPAARLDRPGALKRHRSKVRSGLSLDDDAILAVAPEEMRRDCGHLQAGWAFGIAARLIDNFYLIMPDSGPARRDITFALDAIGNTSEIILVDDDHWSQDLLAGCDLALFVGRYQTSTASLAAAMAAGLPIVASQRPDLAACLPDRASILVECGEAQAAAGAIIALIEDPAARATMGRSARLNARKLFSPDRAGAALAKLYTAIAGP